MEVIIYKRGSRKTHSARKPQAFERTNNAIHSLTYGALCPIIVARILKSWIRFDAIAAKCPPPSPPPSSIPWNHSSLGPMEISRLPWRISRDSLSVFLTLFPLPLRVENLFLRNSIVSGFYPQTSCNSTERSLWREALMQTWRGGLGREKNMFLRGERFLPSVKRRRALSGNIEIQWERAY